MGLLANQRGEIPLVQLPVAPSRRAWSALRRRMPVLISWAIGLGLWEVVGRLANPLIFAPFSKTLVTLWQILRDGTLLSATGVSMKEFSIGFAIGSAAGLIGGLVAGLHKTFNEMTENWVTVLNAAPFAALAPLFLVVLGLGATSKIALAIVACFIPVWINTSVGVRTVDTQLVEMARAFGTSRWKILQSIILPWSLPAIIEGLRMAVARAFLAVIVAEELASQGGLGYLTIVAGQSLRMDELLAAVLVIVLINLVLTSLMKTVQKRAVPWWGDKVVAR